MATGDLGYLTPADIVIIVAYLALTFGVALWTICKGRGNLKNYFLAGRSMVWWPIGLSLFASNIGTNQFIGESGTAAVSGLAVIQFEWNAVLNITLLGWIFLPVYIASGIYTMPEYLYWRFGGKRLRVYLVLVALFTYAFATASTDLYAGALFLTMTMQWNMYTGIGVILIICLLFTVLGGTETVILTDAVAAVIMVIGGAALCIIGFTEVDGMNALRYKYAHAVSDFTLNNHSKCGLPRDDAWHIFRDISKADYPWLATMLRTTIGSLWYFCANQMLVQRTLAAKDINHAKGGAILACYLKLLPMYIIIFPGMISRVLYPNQVACANPDDCMAACQSEVGCSSIAYPYLVAKLAPAGLRGLLVSSQIAAAISSLTSTFNSAGTMFTMDLWIRLRPKASTRELGIMGRLFIIIMVGVVIAWIPVIQNAKGGEVYLYVSAVNGYLGAPTCAMFLLAMFWARTTEPGAFWGMLVAQIWGLIRFVLDLVYPSPTCGDSDTRPQFMIDFMKYFHEYYHTASQILLAFVVAAIISFFTKSLDKEALAGLTYWSRYDKPLKDKQNEAKRAAKLAIESDNHSKFASHEKVDDNYRMATMAYNEADDPNGVRKRSTYDGRVNYALENTWPSSQDAMNESEMGRKTNYIPEAGTREMKAKEPETKESQWTSLKNIILVALTGSAKSSSNSYDEDQDQDDGADDHESRVSRIYQKSFKRIFLNINVVIIWTITIFLYGFYY